MRLQNITAVLLARNAQSKMNVKRIVANPLVARAKGQVVYGPYLRRLLTVKEVAQREGLSLNKAADARRANPLAYLADFPGQEPLAEMLRQAALAA